MTLKNKDKCVWRYLHEAAEADLPCPTNAKIMLDLRIGRAKDSITTLTQLGAMSVERHPETAKRRRVVFPDGKMTDWTDPDVIQSEPAVRTPSEAAELAAERRYAGRTYDNPSRPKARPRAATGLLAGV